MITDKQRREIAAKMRNAKVYGNGSGPIPYFAEGTLFGATLCANDKRDLERAIEMIAYSIDRPTCTYEPTVIHSWLDDDDIEHDTDCADEDYGYCTCSNCGYSMMGGEEGWFDEKPGEHGGLVLTPRFKYCPDCGLPVVPYGSHGDCRG